VPEKAGVPDWPVAQLQHETAFAPIPTPAALIVDTTALTVEGEQPKFALQGELTVVRPPAPVMQIWLLNPGLVGLPGAIGFCGLRGLRGLDGATGDGVTFGIGVAVITAPSVKGRRTASIA